VKSMSVHLRGGLPGGLFLRRFGKTAAMAAASAVGDSRLFLFDYALRFLRVAVLLAIWRTVLAGRGTVSGMTLGAVLTYTLVAEAFAEQLTPRTQLGEMLWEGSLAIKFLQPVSMVASLSADMCGRWLAGLGLFALPLLLCAPLLGVDPRPAGLAQAAAFVLSVALAVSIGLALEIIFAALAVALESAVWLVDRLRMAITALLSGALLPLALLPWGLGNAFGWLPFASMVSTPLKIYTGTGDAPALLALQAAWSVVLWPLAHWYWNANRERLASHGG